MQTQKNKNHNRNKYLHLIKPKINEKLPDLPMHLMESIINLCDDKTKANWLLTSKQINNYIGDIRPVYFINQKYFIELLQQLCTCDEYDYFNLSILSKDYHIIVSNEENNIIKITFIDRKNRLKTLKRSYGKSFLIKSFINLFKGIHIFYGTPLIAKDFFISIFNNIKNISLSTNENPTKLIEWKKYLNSIIPV